MIASLAKSNCGCRLTPLMLWFPVPGRLGPSTRSSKSTVTPKLDGSTAPPSSVTHEAVVAATRGAMSTALQIWLNHGSFDPVTNDGMSMAPAQLRSSSSSGLPPTMSGLSACGPVGVRPLSGAPADGCHSCSAACTGAPPSRVATTTTAVRAAAKRAFCVPSTFMARSRSLVPG